MSAELGKSGKAIWDAYGAAQLDAGSRSLILELARAADTCDRLDGLVTGRQDRWALLVFDDMGEIHLSIDKILDERIKAQGILKQLHAEVRTSGLKAVQITGTDETEKGPEDMLAKRRRENEQRERQSG